MLERGVRELTESGVEEAKLDAWLLLSDCLRVDRAEFHSRPNVRLKEEEWEAYQAHIARRKAGTPYQYVVGNVEFMGLPFCVTPHVLIPRQDTESLVEEALKVAGGKRVLDLCTGSGCIILSLAKLSHLKRAVGSDVSGEALAVAKKNGESLGARVEWVLGDVWDGLGEDVFDVVVSNPPYIERGELPGLPREVREHEPSLALDGGEDGLDVYRRLVAGAGRHLSAGGRMFLEIHCHKAEQVRRLLNEAGFGDVRVVKDLAGLDRVVSATWDGIE